MCERCHRAWIPMNHRASHGLHRLGDRFQWARIHAIRSPFAELRRTAKMHGGHGARLGTKYGPSLRDTARHIERSRISGERK